LDYDDFSLQLGTDGPDCFVIGARSPRGEVSAPFVPPAILAGEAQLGAQLFDAVMAAPVRSLFDESLAVSGEAGRGLRIRLLFDQREPRLAALGDLPWELMYRTDRQRFLALHAATPIVRHLAVHQPNRLSPLVPPLRILVVAATAQGLAPLALASERHALEELATARTNVVLKFLEGATRSSLRQALLDPLDVFHFMGHAGFDARSGEGCLVLDREEPPAGTSRLLLASGGRDLAIAESWKSGSAFESEEQAGMMRSEVLAHLLTGFARPRLAVLNACHTATATSPANHPPFASVAATLVLGGVPAVIAMQLPISDGAALSFSAALYERIAAGEPLEVAVAEGRRATYAARPHSFEWATPSLFLRLENGRLFKRDEIGTLAFATGGASSVAIEMAGIYWYISRAKLDLLKQAEASSLSTVSAQSEFRAPFDYGSSVGTQTSGLVKDLKRVVKALEAQQTIKNFESLADEETPVLIRFEGAAMRRIERQEFWLAMEIDGYALLLAGSAAYAIGQPAKSKGGPSASVDPVRAITAAFAKGAPSRNLSLTLSKAWREVVRDAVSSEGTLPRVEGLAIFARSVKADRETMNRADRSRVKRIVVGTPLYVRQI